MAVGPRAEGLGGPLLWEREGLLVGVQMSEVQDRRSQLQLTRSREKRSVTEHGTCATYILKYLQ
ncbi:hypothetical protein PAMP_024926 [Pampus punctatissimus]